MDTIRHQLQRCRLRRHCRIGNGIVRGVGTVAVVSRDTPAGPVAQWLEPAAHNGLVAGSSPAGPTNEISNLSILIFSTPPEIPTGSGTISAQITESSQWRLRQAGRARRC